LGSVWSHFWSQLSIAGHASGVNTQKPLYTNLGIASLEGALLIARLERNDEALRDAKDHLHGYIEAEIRNHKRG